jgi:hypothetical protein
MGWAILFFIIVGVGIWSRSGTITGTAAGQNVCMFCRKRLKFSAHTDHYATVCPRCGRTQTNR